MCHAATHAWHAQPSFFSLLHTRSRQSGPRRCSQAPCMLVRLRACLSASARSSASAAAQRCSAAASTSSCASVRAFNTWMRFYGQQSLTRHYRDGRLMHRIPPKHACPVLPHAWHAQQSYSQRAAHRFFPVQIASQLPHMHSQLRACLTNSARSCSSAAAKRASAAASASARASVRAWRT